MKRRYPLESLRLAKRHDKETSAAVVAAAGERRCIAENSAASARAASARAKAELLAQVAAEDARVDAGVARVSDLAQGEHHRSGAEAQVRWREDDQCVAEAEAMSARRAEDRAQDALSDARGAERVVEEHRARFVAIESKETDRRDEDEAADGWAAGRGRSEPKGSTPR